jgi:hypothetical protein
MVSFIVAAFVAFLFTVAAQTIPQIPLTEQMSTNLSASEPKKIVIIGMAYPHSLDIGAD